MVAADDWIKMRSNLPACPKVAVIARETRLGAYDVIGRLLKFWAWADQHTTTGVIPGIDAQWIDRYVERRGFARAMMHEAVGWLRVERGAVVLPDYTEHNGTTAKRRAQDAKRKGRVCPTTTWSLPTTRRPPSPDRFARVPRCRATPRRGTATSRCRPCAATTTRLWTRGASHPRESDRLTPPPPLASPRLTARGRIHGPVRGPQQPLGAGVRRWHT